MIQFLKETFKKKEVMMPGFNRKGPNGEGPMSEEGRGLCNLAGRERDDFEARAETETGATNQSRYGRRDAHLLGGSGSNVSFRLGGGRGMRQGQRRGDGSGKGRFV